MSLTGPNPTFLPTARTVVTPPSGVVPAFASGADISERVRWEESAISFTGVNGRATLMVLGEWTPAAPGVGRPPVLIDLTVTTPGPLVASAGRWIVVATDTTTITDGTTVTMLQCRDIAAQLELQLNVVFEAPPGARVFDEMRRVAMLGFGLSGGGWLPASGLVGADPGTLIPPAGRQWPAGSTTLRGILDELAALAGLRRPYATRTGGLATSEELDPTLRTQTVAWDGDVLRPTVRWVEQRALAPNSWDFYNAELSIVLGRELADRLSSSTRSNLNVGPASQMAAGWTSRVSRAVEAADAASLERRIDAAAATGRWATRVSGHVVPWPWVWVGDRVLVTAGGRTAVPVEVTDWTLPLAAHTGDMSWAGNRVGAGT